MPMVMPDSSRLTTSASVSTLLLLMWARSLGDVRRALLDERITVLVGHAAQVQLEREALLVPVRPLHIPQVDAVERLLGGADDRWRLRRYLAGDAHRRITQVCL